MRATVMISQVDLTTCDDRELDELAAALTAERTRREPPPINLSEAEKCLIRGGHAITAIKLIRERYEPRPGLRQAKDACDAYKATLRDDGTERCT
jgi:hypothetical protein